MILYKGPEVRENIDTTGKRGKSMRIKQEDSLVLMVDVQEKLFPHIDGKDGLAAKMSMLAAGSKALGVPMIAARQYPQGLGDIIGELRSYCGRPYDKVTFSCCGDERLLEAIRQSGKKTVILLGIEAHICVLQTVIDLKQHGFLPVVAADAVGSRKTADYEIALRRMEYEGAVLTTVEAILFELCHQAGTDVFKTISRLVK